MAAKRIEFRVTDEASYVHALDTAMRALKAAFEGVPGVRFRNPVNREEAEWLRGLLSAAHSNISEARMCGPSPLKVRNQCADCGEEGEVTGHMTCQYPQDH